MPNIATQYIQAPYTSDKSGWMVAFRTDDGVDVPLELTPNKLEDIPKLPSAISCSVRPDAEVLPRLLRLLADPLLLLIASTEEI